jgi:hypothetical protein
MNSTLMNKGKEVKEFGRDIYITEMPVNYKNKYYFLHH